MHTHLYRACVQGRLAARLAGVPHVVATEHYLGDGLIEGRPVSAGVRAPLPRRRAARPDHHRGVPAGRRAAARLGRAGRADRGDPQGHRHRPSSGTTRRCGTAARTRLGHRAGRAGRRRCRPAGAGQAVRPPDPGGRARCPARSCCWSVTARPGPRWSGSPCIEGVGRPGGVRRRGRPRPGDALRDGRLRVAVGPGDVRPGGARGAGRRAAHALRDLPAAGGTGRGRGPPSRAPGDSPGTIRSHCPGRCAPSCSASRNATASACRPARPATATTPADSPRPSGRCTSGSPAARAGRFRRRSDRAAHAADRVIAPVSAPGARPAPASRSPPPGGTTRLATACDTAGSRRGRRACSRSGR